MATELEGTTVEPIGSGDLLNFNWDDSGDESFFDLNSVGEVPVKSEEPVQVIKTEGNEVETTKEVKEPKKAKPVEEVEDEFFDLLDDGDPSIGDEPEDRGDAPQGSVYEGMYKDLKESGIFKHT